MIKTNLVKDTILSLCDQNDVNVAILKVKAGEEDITNRLIKAIEEYEDKDILSLSDINMEVAYDTIHFDVSFQPEIAFGNEIIIHTYSLNETWEY